MPSRIVLRQEQRVGHRMLQLLAVASVRKHHRAPKFVEAAWAYLSLKALLLSAFSPRALDVGERLATHAGTHRALLRIASRPVPLDVARGGVPSLTVVGVAPPTGSL